MPDLFAKPTDRGRQKQRRSDSKFEEKRDELMLVAAHLFRERGYENTSLQDLADALGVTKPAIYYYVQSKSELLTFIKTKAQVQLYEAIQEASNVEGTGLDKLLTLAPRYIEIMASDFGRCLVRIAPRVLDGKDRGEIEGRNAISQRRMTMFIEEGVKDGSISPRPVIILYAAAFGILNSVAAWYNPQGAIGLRNLKEHYCAILRQALARKA
ncbi:MAG TPA: TetR/AcrR family transcriptional regulator [Caulobacterales bacterium]|nr:TetR/AcrR family transcriptional regulator [Caulobacterales bacterium]